MNISELSSIYLAHSSSPLFSGADSNGNYHHHHHNLISVSHESTSMIEYFSNSSFPMERIFKSTYACQETPFCSAANFQENSSYNTLNSQENRCNPLHQEYILNEHNISFDSYCNEYKLPFKYQTIDSNLSNESNMLGIYHFPLSNRIPLRKIDKNSYNYQVNAYSNEYKENYDRIATHKDFSYNSTSEIISRNLLTPPISTGLSSSSEKSLLIPPISFPYVDIDENAFIISRKNPRSTGDFYKPTLIRGSGREREGRCELCNPRIWLNLKRSTYWYHMNFTHGISSKTGLPYPDPIYVRKSPLVSSPEHDKRQIYEVFCNNCQSWISISIPFSKNLQISNVLIDSFDRSKFSDWFKHSQKCLSSLK